MQIRNLSVHGFQRIAAFSGEIAPLTLFAGPNESGKTSMREAIDFLFTARPGRAGTKKNYHFNVHTGARVANVKASLDGALLLERDVATGRMHGAEPELPAALPYCLDAERFTALEPEARRGFLYGLMGLSTGVDDVKKRLAARGIDSGLIERVAPLLPGGFEPALQEAVRRRVEEKRAWAEIAGEPYGEQKAGPWLAPAPEFHEAALAEAAEAVKGWEAELARLNQAVGRLQAAERSAAEVPKLKEQGKGHAAAAEKRNAAQARAAELKARLEALPPPPGSPAAAQAARSAGGKGQHAVNVPPYTCPHCGHDVHLRAGKLVKELPPPEFPAAAPAAATPAAAPAVDEHAAERASLRTAIRTAEEEAAAHGQAMAEADGALRLAERLEQQPGADDADKGAREDLAAAQSSLRQWRDIHAEQCALQRQAETAKQKTARAGEIHKAVQRWEALAQALSPDGVPADILKEALGPFTAAIEQAREKTGWKELVIGGDMEITYGGYPFAMCSEAAQWRVKAMIAFAVAVCSKIGVVLLDRFDVLDLDGRGEALNWLYSATQDGMLNSALIFGTLKELPGMPPGAAGYWLGEAA